MTKIFFQLQSNELPHHSRTAERYARSLQVLSPGFKSQPSYKLAMVFHQCVWVLSQMDVKLDVTSAGILPLLTHPPPTLFPLRGL